MGLDGGDAINEPDTGSGKTGSESQVLLQDTGSDQHRKRVVLITVAVITIVVITAVTTGFMIYNNRTTEQRDVYQTNEGKAVSSLLDSFSTEADVLEKSTESEYIKNSTAAAASVGSDLGEDKL